MIMKKILLAGGESFRGGEIDSRLRGWSIMQCGLQVRSSCPCSCVSSRKARACEHLLELYRPLEQVYDLTIDTGLNFKLKLLATETAMVQLMTILQHGRFSSESGTHCWGASVPATTFVRSMKLARKRKFNQIVKILIGACGTTICTRLNLCVTTLLRGTVPFDSKIT